MAAAGEEEGQDLAAELESMNAEFEAILASIVKEDDEEESNSTKSSEGAMKGVVETEPRVDMDSDTKPGTASLSRTMSDVDKCSLRSTAGRSNYEVPALESPTMSAKAMIEAPLPRWVDAIERTRVTAYSDMESDAEEEEEEGEGEGKREEDELRWEDKEKEKEKEVGVDPDLAAPRRQGRTRGSAEDALQSVDMADAVRKRVSFEGEEQTRTRAVGERDDDEEEAAHDSGSTWGGGWTTLLSKAGAVATAALDAAAAHTHSALDVAENVVAEFLEPLDFDDEDGRDGIEGTLDDDYGEALGAGPFAREYMALLEAPKTKQVTVSAGTAMQLPFLVEAYEACLWRVRVKHLDVRFSVKVRRQALGGAVEDELVRPGPIYSAEVVTGGHFGALDRPGEEGHDYLGTEDNPRPRQIVLTFDNTYSAITDKTVCYQVLKGTELSASDLKEIRDTQETIAVSFEEADTGASTEGTSADAATLHSHSPQQDARITAAMEADLLIDRIRSSGGCDVAITLQNFPLLWRRFHQVCSLQCSIIPGVELDVGFPHVSFPRLLAANGLVCLGSLDRDVDSDQHVSATLKCVSYPTARPSSSPTLAGLESPSFDDVDLELSADAPGLELRAPASSSDVLGGDGPGGGTNHPGLCLCELRVVRLGPSPVYVGYYEWRMSLSVRNLGGMPMHQLLVLCRTLNFGAEFYLVSPLNSELPSGELRHEPEITAAMGW